MREGVELLVYLHAFLTSALQDMGVNGQIHVSAALPPEERGFVTPTGLDAEWASGCGCGNEKNLPLPGIEPRFHGSPFLHPVA
jgi:hypothetical protein